MNKERNVIEVNPTVVFDGDVKWSEVEELFRDFKGDIVIHGDLELEKDSRIICDNIYIMGSIREEGCVDVTVEGTLFVYGEIDCCNLTVNGSVFCNEYMCVFETNVSEDLYSKRAIDACGYDINVGGDFVCDSEIEAADITVLGKFYVAGRIEADSIFVG